MTGNANGKITVVEFFDYQCPHCVDMAPVIEGIVKANPDVRIVFKEFPIRGPLSEFAARAALAANKQGKYYEFSHALLISKEPLTQESVLETAKKVGVNVDQLKKDMADKSVDEQLKANIKLAQDLKLFGTPAFFIGKTDAKAPGSVSYIPGQMDQTQMQSTIDKAK
ncbi:MAG: DsbA family protein [Gammaproteobacteria bacterium]